MNAMIRNPRFTGLTTMVLAAAILGLSACAGKKSNADGADPNSAMRAHIAANTGSSGYPIFDGPTGKLLNLKFMKLHTKVKQKGDYHVSCADFQDSAGNKYDIDFVAAKTGSGYRVMEAWLHKKDGVKRPYSVMR